MRRTLSAHLCAAGISFSRVFLSAILAFLCASSASAFEPTFCFSYAALKQRYEKLADDIQRIEQELEADNEAQVATARALLVMAMKCHFSSSLTTDANLRNVTPACARACSA